MTKKTLLDDHRLNLTLPRQTWTALDGWRRTQPDLPTRLQAVRRILDEALASNSPKPRQVRTFAQSLNISGQIEEGK